MSTQGATKDSMPSKIQDPVSSPEEIKAPPALPICNNPKKSWGISRTNPPRKIWKRVRRYAQTKQERTLAANSGQCAQGVRVSQLWSEGMPRTSVDDALAWLPAVGAGDL